MKRQWQASRDESEAETSDVAIESDRYLVHAYSPNGFLTYELAFSYKPK